MKKSELIKQLEAIPGDPEIILQKDAEGNSYSPLSDVDGKAVYVAETTWHGEVYSTDWPADDAGFATEEEWVEFIAAHPHCCVLAPVN